MGTSSITANLFARLGNQLFVYSHLRKRAELEGVELHTHPWVGQILFEINDPPIDGTERMLPEDYHQRQESLIYTREDCRRWFKIRQPLADAFAAMNPIRPEVVAHYRAGDYASLGYPVVSKKAHIDAIKSLTNGTIFMFCEEHGTRGMMEDFWIMTQASILFRANSSFSYWAAVLSNAEVYAPLVDDLIGGQENDNVTFVKGNHPRLAMYEFTTDLHLTES